MVAYLHDDSAVKGIGGKINWVTAATWVTLDAVELRVKRAGERGIIARIAKINHDVHVGRERFRVRGC